MKRLAALFALLAFVVHTGLPIVAGDAKTEAVKKELEALKGTWRAVAAEKEGDKLDEDQLKGVTLTYDGAGKATVKKSIRILYEGVVKVDPTKRPKAMDLKQTSEGANQDKTFLAIYEIDGDTLKVCSAEPGKDRPTEFSGKLGSGCFLRVYKREKK